jgi:cation diffusion facilitator family transporter
MSETGGNRAIIAALSANLGIAITKLIAWVFSGSSSMLAEGVHSLADSGNQILLLIGGRRARKRADKEHPFGYGRERYVFAFVVSIILFSVGGVFSIYEGVEKVTHPHPLEVWWLPVLVLLISIGLESFSLRTGVRESRPHKGDESWFQFIRRAKAPELPVVLLEDVAALTGLVFALVGVGLSAITGDGIWDGIGTLFIGALLITVAIVLGIETQSLLVGEGANDRDLEKIEKAVLAGGEAERIIHMKTLYLGPDELLVAAKLGMTSDKSLTSISADTNAIEARIRAAVPIARVIYIEPDVYVESSGNPAESAEQAALSADALSAEKPTTESIVIKGLE